MRLVPSGHVRLGPDEVVFRQSFWPALTVACGALIAAVLVWVARAQGALPLPVAAIGTLGLLLVGGFAAASLRRTLAPANWLMACDGRRLLLEIRSYLNADFPAELPHALELPLDEIERAVATRLDIEGQNRAGDPSAEKVLFLDLRVKPAVDLSELQRRLRQERELRRRGTAWRDYPVSVLDEHTIRIEWRSVHARITPSIDRALRLLGQHAVPADTLREEHVDLGDLRRAPAGSDPARQVRALAEQGRILEATLLAERTFGWSTTEARRFVDELMR